MRLYDYSWARPWPEERVVLIRLLLATPIRQAHMFPLSLFADNGYNGWMCRWIGFCVQSAIPLDGSMCVSIS